MNAMPDYDAVSRPEDAPARSRRDLDDAWIIAKGIRLGGSAKIVAALEAARAERALRPDRIELLAHPGWDRIEVEERLNEPRREGVDSVGLARLYGPEKTDAPGLAPTWALAAS
ncbi:hypothetical protein ACWCXX_06330 [Streptomyces sp. NPDC001732]